MYGWFVCGIQEDGSVMAFVYLPRANADGVDFAAPTATYLFGKEASHRIESRLDCTPGSGIKDFSSVRPFLETPWSPVLARPFLQMTDTTVPSPPSPTLRSVALGSTPEKSRSILNIDIETGNGVAATPLELEIELKQLDLAPEKDSMLVDDVQKNAIAASEPPIPAPPDGGLQAWLIVFGVM